MAKTVAASEAKNRLGALMGWVVEKQEEVIIENRGEPSVVVISFSEYKKLLAHREEERRSIALSRLRQIRERVNARNADLNESQAEEIAMRFSHELIDDMAADGIVSFERDS